MVTHDGEDGGGGERIGQVLYDHLRGSYLTGQCLVPHIMRGAIT